MAYNKSIRLISFAVGLLLVACGREKTVESDQTFFYAAAEVSRWLGIPISDWPTAHAAHSFSFEQQLAGFSPVAAGSSPWAIKSEETSGGAVVVLLYMTLEVNTVQDSIRYGQHTIYRWANGWAVCQLDAKWYCYEEQASLERLLDQFDQQAAKSFVIPANLRAGAWLALFEGGWKQAKPAPAFFSEAWGFVAEDTSACELVGAFSEPPAASRLGVLGALSRLPPDAVAYQIYSSDTAAEQPLVYLRLPAAELLGRAVSAAELFPKASQQYLHIGIWEEAKDRLGWGAEAIYQYAVMDGYLWQANNLAALQAMILRSSSQAAQQVDHPALQAFLPALAKADRIMFKPFKDPQGSQQQLLVWQSGERVAAQLLAPIATTSGGWETDLGYPAAYWQFSAYSSHWLSQSAGGEVKLGKGQAWQSLGFHSPLLAGPFTVEKNKVVWQSTTALYRYTEGQFDSLPFPAYLGGISFRDPLRDEYRLAMVDTSGQLRLFGSELQTYPQRSASTAEAPLVSSPAILQEQDGGGGFLVALGADRQLYAFDLQGRLRWSRSLAGLLLPERGWLRASNSLAPREDLCPSVSQNDPKRPWQLRNTPANTFLALRIGEEAVVLMSSGLEKTLHRPYPEQAITELLVIEEAGNDFVLLRYGQEVRAFEVKKEAGQLQLAARWQVRLPQAAGYLLREEAAGLWGVFYPAERKAYYYKGAQKRGEWRADFPPRYDLLEEEWLCIYESLLSGQKATN